MKYYRINNTLSARDFNSTKIGFLLLGLFYAALGIVVALVYRLYVFPFLLIPIGGFFCQQYYRYNWYSLDFCNVAVIQKPRNLLVNRILIGGLLEYKALLGVAYLAIVVIFRVELFPVLFLFMAASSVVSSAFGVRLKRHNGIRILSAFMGGVGGFVFIMLFNLMRGVDGFRAIFQYIDSSLAEHWVIASVVTLVFLVAIYALCYRSVSRNIEIHPFVNREVMAKNIRYVHV